MRSFFADKHMKILFKWMHLKGIDLLPVCVLKHSLNIPDVKLTACSCLITFCEWRCQMENEWTVIHRGRRKLFVNQGFNWSSIFRNHSLLLYFPEVTYTKIWYKCDWIPLKTSLSVFLIRLSLDHTRRPVVRTCVDGTRAVWSHLLENKT